MNLVCSKCGAQLNTAGNCIAGCGSPAISTICGWCGRGLPGDAPPLAARLAELEAELAERTRERDEWRQSAFNRAARCVGQSDMINIRTRDLVAERERQEAAEKDAARYRWLRNDALQFLVSGPICVAADKWGTPLTQYPNHDAAKGPAMPITLDGKELDAAIDAVMKD